MLRMILSGFYAGILISIGGTVFLSCDNRYIGALLFTVALLCICYKGYSLYTGKIGYMAEKHSKEEFAVLIFGLLGNIIGTFVCGYIVGLSGPALIETAKAMCDIKLTQLWYQTLIKGFFCGVLMYLAVSIYRDKKTPLGIIFCIPVFIISGFEHSIADMFYFSAARIISLKSIVFILIVILGNTLGSLTLSVFGAKKEVNN